MQRTKWKIFVSELSDVRGSIAGGVGFNKNQNTFVFFNRPANITHRIPDVNGLFFSNNKHLRPTDNDLF
jgi:hypothetical protein